MGSNINNVTTTSNLFTTMPSTSKVRTMQHYKDECSLILTWFHVNLCIPTVYDSVSPSAEPFTEVLSRASCRSASEMAVSTSCSSTASCILIIMWYSTSTKSVGDSDEQSVSSSGRLRRSMSHLSSAASSCFWVRSSRRLNNDFWQHTHHITGWRRGVVVTELVVSTKLLYVEPG